MYGANSAKDISLPQNNGLKTVGTVIISKRAGLTLAGANHGVRTSIFLGKIISVASTVTLQQSVANGFYTNMQATATLANSTNKTTTTDIGADASLFTSTSHGFADRQLVAVTAASLPVALSASKMYQIQLVSANSFRLTEKGSDVAIVLAANATTMLTTAVSEVVLTSLVTDSTDDADFPLGDSIRVSMTVAADEQAQVLGVFSTGVI